MCGILVDSECVLGCSFVLIVCLFFPVCHNFHVYDVIVFFLVRFSLRPQGALNFCVP